LADPIIIVGGGHAAAALCGALADEGMADQVVLYSDEPLLPYERPPLSKTFIAADDASFQYLRQEDWFKAAGIDMRLGERIARIDRERRVLVSESGEETRFGRLVIATGARPRQLPGMPSDLENVIVLRDASDATRLRKALGEVSALTVVGAGFIGLEAAATASRMGRKVTVLEVGPRILGRAVSAEMSEHVRRLHEASGIHIRTGVQIGKTEVRDGRLVGFEVDGVPEPVELLLVGIGGVPRTELALEAGLACDDGILVDAAMRTSDDGILAIGDCSRYDCGRYLRSLRLESVQNANDQAKVAAATLAGRPADSYSVLPWFWSDQGDVRLQMAGLIPVTAQQWVRPGKSADSFSILHFADGQLACIESLNASADHVVAKRLMNSNKTLDPKVVSDPGVSLRTLL
jgi:3-phenylpropionate/trans-cinnamate dioxygenase ferredoxin reductase subunit